MQKKTKKQPQTRKRRNSKVIKTDFKVTLDEHHHDDSNKMTYWMALLVLVVCNFVISIVLIPFLIILEKTPLYMIVMVLGIMFGALFKLLLSSIKGLEQEHQTLAQFFVPALSVVNIAVIATLSNKMIYLLDLGTENSPGIIGLVYALAFIIPFIYMDVLLKLKKFMK